MIRLATKNLSAEAIAVLNDLQQKINEETTFETKVAKAQSLWKSKGGADGKDAFVEISAELEGMCTFTGVCHYCEQNEGNDIEHIYPKSFFPAYTFIWDNYLLACKECNTGKKLDKCYVLDDNDDLVETVRANEPAHLTIAFINPRIEDPNTFLILDHLTDKFLLLPDLSKKDRNKANATLEILELNERDTLVEARLSAGRHYYETLDRLHRILSAETIEALRDQLTPYDNRFDLTKSLDDLKQEIKDSYKRYVTNYQHPSVWYTIKTIHSKFTPRWTALFHLLPEEALSW
jgi:uncharacterized protein (TIGR02646 family)